MQGARTRWCCQGWVNLQPKLLCVALLRAALTRSLLLQLHSLPWCLASHTDDKLQEGKGAVQ